MSRRPDRKKHGKENSASASSKDESDAATLRSSDMEMHFRSLQSGRSADPHASLLQLKENSAALQLLSETGNSEMKQADCKSSILESLESLEGKINALLQKSGMSDSPDKESVELHAEMKKLLQATMKQKDDFNHLYETVRRQKDMLQRLEAMAKTGSLGQPIASGIDSTEVLAVQCSHDLETRADHDATIVYVISGRYEFRRKLSQSSDELINVYIPDSVNLGSRMLPGRQSFPNNLLQSLAFDTSANSPTVSMTQRPRTTGMGSELRGSELGAVGGGKELLGSERSCPICNKFFLMTEMLEVFERHVQSHFEEY